jgi:hypothetical protein
MIAVERAQSGIDAQDNAVHGTGGNALAKIGLHYNKRLHNTPPGNFIRSVHAYPARFFAGKRFQAAPVSLSHRKGN